jgi:hypothetical protein
MAPLALAARGAATSSRSVSTKLGALYAAATLASTVSLATHAPAPAPFAQWELPSAE